jgi:hypothetical protein
MCESNDKQWRIDLAGDHLRGQKFRLQRYKQWGEAWDHDHCEACTIKFAELETDADPDVQLSGYASTAADSHGARYHWVCARCFKDLKDDLGWTEADDSDLSA